MLRTLLLAVLLVACEDTGPKPEVGAADACASAPEALLEDEEDDVVLDVSGTVTEVLAAVPNSEFGTGGCAAEVLDRGFRLDVDGQEVLIGFNVRDGAGNDLLPADPVAVGDEVDVLFRSRMVWGSVEGLAVRDADGVVLAVEQGTWGGALEPGDVDGLEATFGEVVAKKDEPSCGHWNGHEVVLTAPDQPAVALEPVSTGPISLDGQQLTAVAAAALTYHEGSGCMISDTTDRLSWALYR